MMESGARCGNCKGACVKNGKSKTGFQRYYCKQCRKTFQLWYVYKGCQREISKMVASLTVEGCGIRSISRVLKIAVATVMKRIRSVARSVIRPFPILKGREYEVDEMRTYIGNKGRLYWITYAIRKDTKEVIDFRVGKRTMKTLQSVLDTLLYSEAKKISTDGYTLYENLIPEHLHKRSKYQINYIERKNLSVRTHLKRLSRKTICFSKSKEMLENCLRIYFWGGNLCLSL